MQSLTSVLGVCLSLRIRSDQCFRVRVATGSTSHSPPDGVLWTCPVSRTHISNRAETAQSFRQTEGLQSYVLAGEPRMTGQHPRRRLGSPFEPSPGHTA